MNVESTAAARVGQLGALSHDIAATAVNFGAQLKGAAKQLEPLLVKTDKTTSHYVDYSQRTVHSAGMGVATPYSPAVAGVMAGLHELFTTTQADLADQSARARALHLPTVAENVERTLADVQK